MALLTSKSMSPSIGFASDADPAATFSVRNESDSRFDPEKTLRFTGLDELKAPALQVKERRVAPENAWSRRFS